MNGWHSTESVKELAELAYEEFCRLDHYEPHRRTVRDYLTRFFYDRLDADAQQQAVMAKETDHVDA